MAQTESEIVQGIGSDYEIKYGFSVPEDYFFKSGRGLSHELVDAISSHKNEPEWMRKFRHKSLDYFYARPMPTWGGDMSGIDFENIYYYIRPTEKQADSWDDLPADIKDTWDKLGIPEAEKKYLAGVGAQYESEVVYHKLQKELEDQGVIFLDMDSGLREHEDIVKQYFGTVIPQNDNKFAALNSAVWSGGSFIYVPPGVRIEMPLQAYFRINAENMGQFERTMIIVDEDAYVHYVEGCTAPIYSSDSLHSAVVEIIVKPRGRCRYTTIQNWSTNVYNLVTKRAVAYEDATMEWVDGNLGSKLTMKYPAIWLVGPRAHGEVLSIAFAGAGQHQDAGGKVVHHAKDTTSVITSKSISKSGGRAGYRGLLEVAKGATGSKSKVVCDALILDEESRSDTYPYIRIDENEVDIGHEATVSKIGEEQLFYLMSRGLSEAEASAMIVSGFVEPITKELPLEYAVEMNRLIQLQMEGSVGWTAMEVEKLDFVAIPSPDAERSRTFYVETLGLRPDAKAQVRVLGRRHVLRDLGARARGPRVRAAAQRAPRAPRRRRRRCTRRARGQGRRVLRRDVRHRRVPHGVLPRSGRQRPHAPPPVQAACLSSSSGPTSSGSRCRTWRGRRPSTATSFGMHSPDWDKAWPEIETGNVSIYLTNPAALGREFVAHSSAVALRVPDVPAAKAELEQRGVVFDGEHDTGVCKMAFFRDSEGNALMLHRRYAP